MATPLTREAVLRILMMLLEMMDEQNAEDAPPAPPVPRATLMSPGRIPVDGGGIGFSG